MENSDRMLIRRLVREDDAEAFSALVAQYAGMVYGTCRRVLGNDAQAADAGQETFFQLLKHANHIQGSVASWLHQVATRRAVDLVRQEASRRRREAKYAADRLIDSDSWEGIEPLVDEALDELPEDLRELLILHYLNGQSTTKIAIAKGVSQPTISRRVAAALDSLRQKLRARDVTVGLAVLASLMANSAQAAPESLLQALGKLTLAKAASSGTGVMAATVKWLSTTALKAGLTSAAVVLVAGTGYVALHHSATKQRSSIPASVSPANPASSARKDSAADPNIEVASAPAPTAVPGETLETNQEVAQFALSTNLLMPPQAIPGRIGRAVGGVGGGPGSTQVQSGTGGDSGRNGGVGGFVSGGSAGARVGEPPPDVGPERMPPNMQGGTGMGMSFGGGGGVAWGGTGMTSFNTNFAFMRTMRFSNGMTWETQTVYSSGSATPVPARGKP